MPKRKVEEETVSEQDLINDLDELMLEFEELIKQEKEMAKAKAKPTGPVKQLSDKLAKVNESFTINMYDNGYMIEVGGRDHDEEWKTAKIMVTEVDELLALVREATEMTRDS